jgi:threonine dehydrogenase-like Zn-dependent dehydrogenase
LSQSATPAALSSGSSESLREVVLAGPGSTVAVAGDGAAGALAVVACPTRVAAALKAAGYVDARRRLLTGSVTAVPLRDDDQSPRHPAPPRRRRWRGFVRERVGVRVGLRR